MSKPDWSKLDLSPLIESACKHGVIDGADIVKRCLEAGFTEAEAKSALAQLSEMWKAHSTLKNAKPTGISH